MTIETRLKEVKNPGNAVPLEGIDLFRRQDGRLVLRQRRGDLRTETPIRVACCFPWNHRREFISLRNDKGKELILVERMDQLETGARELIEEELDRGFFVPRITAVHAIDRRGDLFVWQAETDAGPRSFLTGRGEHPRNLPGGRVLIKDVSNDLYVIDDPKALDAKSRKVLWAYLD